MNFLQSQWIQTLILLPLGLAFIWFCMVLGSLFDFLFTQNKINRKPVFTRLLLGYLLVSSLFSVAYFQGKTIFSIILVFLMLVLWRGKSTFRPDWGWPMAGFQTGLFVSLWLFRVLSLSDFDTGLFAQVFKDDYFYITNIAAMAHFGVENVVYESLNQKLGFASYYSVYHYFSFTGAVLLKVFTGINSFLLFHFFSVPFFQFLAMMGLIFIGLKSNLHLWKATLLAGLVFSTLRYNGYDDFLIKWINHPGLNRNLIFKNFYGVQFLNSGFGLKFSIALAFICLIYLCWDEIRILKWSFLLIFINPLMAFISGSVFIQLILNKRKGLVPYVLCTFGSLFAFVAFGRIVGGRPVGLNLEEVGQNIQSHIDLGFNHFMFFTIGEIMNQAFNAFLVPLLLIIWRGKGWPIRIFGIMFLAYPFANTFLEGTLIYKGFILLLMASFVWVLMQFRTSQRVFFFSLIFLITTIFSRFSLVFPEVNQAFMFITFTFPIVIALHILVRLKVSSSLFWGLAGLLFLHNLQLNLAENRVRNIVTAPDTGYMERLQNWVNKQSIKDFALIGVYDSKMTLQFLNQFLTGEEIAMVDDRFFPTPVSIPQLDKQNPGNSAAIKALIPICNFNNVQSNADTTAAFINRFGVKAVVVSDEDAASFSPSRALFSDSLVNPKRKYRIYLRE